MTKLETKRTKGMLWTPGPSEYRRPDWGAREGQQWETLQGALAQAGLPVKRAACLQVRSTKNRLMYVRSSHALCWAPAKDERNLAACRFSYYNRAPRCSTTDQQLGSNTRVN